MNLPKGNTVTSELECFLHDLLDQMIERAKECNDRKKGAGIGAQNEDFESGRAFAYYEVVSKIIGLANAFNVSPDAVAALRFDANRELLS